MSKVVVHLTSVHPRYDTRIFFKECVSLYKYGYEVHLIVADGKGDVTVDGIKIWDIGKPKNRINRIVKSTKEIFKKALLVDGDIYHLHDPELLPIGLKLEKSGKKVIFDIHENISLQIKDKVYLPYFFRKPFSLLYRYYEHYALKKFDALILAEDSYKSYYVDINVLQNTILNFPDIDRLEEFQVECRDNNELFYIGGISNERGLDVTIEALKLVKKEIDDVYMHYVGNVYDDILDSLNLDGIENNIKFYGHMPLYDGLELSKKASLGLSILKPIKNYMHSYSTKVFEYMAIGLPVITSNFPLYKDVVEKYECGYCIDPENPRILADSICNLLRDKDKIKEMSLNGVKIARKKYNWKNEEKKLFDIYKGVLDDK